MSGLWPRMSEESSQRFIRLAALRGHSACCLGRYQVACSQSSARLVRSATPRPAAAQGPRPARERRRPGAPGSDATAPPPTAIPGQSPDQRRRRPPHPGRCAAKALPGRPGTRSRGSQAIPGERGTTPRPLKHLPARCGKSAYLPSLRRGSCHLLTVPGAGPAAGAGRPREVSSGTA